MMATMNNARCVPRPLPPSSPSLPPLLSLCLSDLSSLSLSNPWPALCRFWNNWFQGVIRGNFASGTFPQRRAYVSLSDGQNRMHAMNPYDQYEVSIPLATAGDCLEELGRLMYGPYALWTGTRTPFLTRFVKGEVSFAALSHALPTHPISLSPSLSLSFWSHE